MKSQRGLSTIKLLTVGIVIGVAITILFGLILCYIEGEALSIEPKTFGDIKVWAQKPLVAEGTEVPAGFYQEAHKLLWMTKDDSPFLMIAQNEAGKATGLYLLKNKDEPVLCLEPLSSLGKWGRAKYSRGNGTGKAVGDVFVDIDFDGQFDFKLALDSSGNLISRSIFVNGSWQKVDRCSIKKLQAAIGQTMYTFDPNSGWRRTQ
ncbi:hypothetical protein ES703_69052 [subsurface metagenome]